MLSQPIWVADRHRLSATNYTNHRLSCAVLLCGNSPTLTLTSTTFAILLLREKVVYFLCKIIKKSQFQPVKMEVQRVMTLSPLCLGLCTRDVELHGKHERQSWSHRGSSGSHRNPECCHQPPLHAPGEKEKRKKEEKKVEGAIVTDQNDQISCLFSTFIHDIRWVKNIQLLGQCDWLGERKDESNPNGHKCASTATYGGRSMWAKWVMFLMQLFLRAMKWAAAFILCDIQTYSMELLCQTPGVSVKATGSELQSQS